jgi:excisionase family DNA binding protein
MHLLSLRKVDVNPEAPQDLVAPIDAAAMLSVDPKTVSRWANGGKIRAIRTPGGHRRFLRSEILALAANVSPTADPATSPTGLLRPSASAQTSDEHLRRDDQSISERWAAALVAEAVAQAARAQADQAAREVVETAAAVEAAASAAAAAAGQAREVRRQAAEVAADAIAREAAYTAAQVKLRADATARELCQSASDAAALVLAAHNSGRDPEEPALALRLALAAVAASVAAAEENVDAAVRVASSVAAAAATVAARVAAEDLAIEHEVARVAAAVRVAAAAAARHRASDVDGLAGATSMIAREAARAVRRRALDRARTSPSGTS